MSHDSAEARQFSLRCRRHAGAPASRHGLALVVPHSQGPVCPTASKRPGAALQVEGLVNAGTAGWQWVKAFLEMGGLVGWVGAVLNMGGLRCRARSLSEVGRPNVVSWRRCAPRYFRTGPFAGVSSGRASQTQLNQRNPATTVIPRRLTTRDPPSRRRIATGKELSRHPNEDALVVRCGGIAAGVSGAIFYLCLYGQRAVQLPPQQAVAAGTSC